MNGLPKIFYESRFADAAPVASTTASGYSVLNVRDWRPYTWWKATVLPATITVDCGVARAADYLLVYGEAATYEVRGSTDNFAASDVPLGSVTLTALGFGLVLFASVSYRYWRLRQTGSGTPAVAIAAPGAALEFPRRMASGFDPIGRSVEGQSNRSERGHPLGSVIDFEEWSGSLSFKNLSQSWVRGTFVPAWKTHLRGSPFLFAWDPVDHASELYLVKAGPGYKTPHGVGQYCDLQFDVKGVAA